MNDRRGLREEYGDLLGPGDDAGMLEVVRLLDAAGSEGRPPHGMSAAVRTAIRERAAGTASTGAEERHGRGWEAVPEEMGSPPPPGPSATARPQRHRRLFPALPRLGRAAGLATFVLLVGAIVVGLATVLPGMRDRSITGTSAPEPGPGEVRFRLTIEGDLPEDEAFLVQYEAGGPPRDAPLCGPKALLAGAPNASVPPCRGGGTYETTVDVDETVNGRLLYTFVNRYAEGGRTTGEGFAGTGDEHAVPAGRTYAATYTFPPGIGSWRASAPATVPPYEPMITGRIAAAPTNGRLQGSLYVRAHHSGSGAEQPGYRVGVTYRTVLLARESGGEPRRVGYGYLKQGQTVRVWIAGVMRLTASARATAQTIVVEGGGVE